MEALQSSLRRVRGQRRPSTTTSGSVGPRLLCRWEQERISISSNFTDYSSKFFV